MIALAVERQQDGETLVTVLPVTHRPPNDAAAAFDSAGAKRQKPAAARAATDAVNDASQNMASGHRRGAGKSPPLAGEG